jgi:class 3 adenylate cyclase/tetratricopeptide (TPR) repeat protein
MLTCTACGTQNEPGAKFCIECGTRMAVACPSCGTDNPGGAKFCRECGTGLAADDSPPRTAAGTPEDPRAPNPVGPVAERRLVSVMFTDLVGFTTVSEQHDAEETRDLLSRYFETAQEIVERHGGVVEKFIGDAVMAVWGTPTAHEDDAERAVRTALELVAAVSGLEIGGAHLQARAGVLTGEAAVTIGATNQGMVAGDLVNTASRIQSAASPGSVLAGEATMRAASGAITFEEAGERELKGKAAPVPVWRATAVVARRGGSGRAAQLEPPFVGRDEELRALKEQFHATAREGKPRLVTIIGQAGIGKSRLGWELEKYLDGVVENIWFHEGRSPSYGEGISYWALAEMVRGRAGIAESDDTSSAREQLRASVEQFVTDPAERRWIEPRLAGLLGLEELPAESREELFAAWRTFFERMAEQGTVLLVFWDLQWADQGLLDFVEHLLTWARSSPIFVLAEARPDLLERRSGWGQGVRAATSIHLEPLSDDDMRLLLTGLVPGMPEPALQAIVGRAEGVPLYAVETLRMLLDRGILHAEDGRYTLGGGLPDLAVPETLHALIAARLDALDPGARALAADASVLGLSFAPDALAAVSGLDAPALEERLAGLVRHEILVLDVDPRSPERGQHRFVQGVVREVAYQSLARRDRRTKHLAAARHYESLGEDEIAGVLASHYLAAYRATGAGAEADALAAQARVALRAAADRAMALHSLVGAETYLEQALEVTSDPAERAALHERAGNAAIYAARMDAGIAHAEEAERIARELHDRQGVLRARTLQANAKLAEHGDRAAIEILEAALAEAGSLEPSGDLARAQSELARALMISGDPRSVEWSDRVLAQQAVLTQNDLVEILITKGTALVHLGSRTEAEVILRGCIAVADLAGNPMNALRARNNLQGVVASINLASALALLRETFEVAERFGQRTWVQQAIGSALSTAFELGDWDAWLPEMEAERANASEFYLLWYEEERIQRQIYQGDPDDAERRLRAVMAHSVLHDSAQAMASSSGLLAEIHLAQGRWEDAREAGRTAQSVGDAALWGTACIILAAAASGNAAWIGEALDALSSALGTGSNDVIAIQSVGTAVAALIEGGGDQGRTAFAAARRALDELGATTMLARFQLAVGHLARDRFPEATDAALAADRFFAERAATAFVTAYRARAWEPGRSPGRQPARSARKTEAPSQR